MTQKIATILHINLTDGTFAIKVREDLWPVIGGVGYALFLLKENRYFHYRNWPINRGFPVAMSPILAKWMLIKKRSKLGS